MPMTIMKYLIPAGILSLFLNSCVVRTVTSPNGEVIYKKTVPHTPWDSEKKKMEDVQKTELELGVQ